MKSIREVIVNNAVVGKLMESLHDYPKRMYDASDRLIEKENEIAVMEEIKPIDEEINALKGELLYEVTAEVTEDKKPVFKNKETRDAEVSKRLTESPQARELFAKRHAAVQAKQQRSFEYAKLRNTTIFVRDQFNAARSIAQLVTGLCHEESVEAIDLKLKNNENAKVISRIREVTNELAKLTGQANDNGNQPV